MKMIRKISPEILHYLEEYRNWIFQDRVQSAIQKRLRGVDSRLLKETEAGQYCTIDHLMSIDHNAHVGFPEHWYGADLNYQTMQNESAQYDAAFFQEVRQVGNELDDNLQNLLGARFCGLKAFYPEQGYIPWHTNWNASNYVMIFTHSPTGNGYWRHIDPAGSRSIIPDAAKLVHIPDPVGWHCKVAHFGNKLETDKLVWHCAHSSEPRITVSYLFPERSLWENVLEEIGQ